MTDFLDEKRREIAERLKELRPLVAEYERLEAAAAALDGLAAPTEAARAPRARRSVPRRASSASPPAPTGRPRGRPKGSGTRGKEALRLVRANPGITIPELAAKMGIKQNYLYRVLPGLVEENLVVKDGRGWHAKDAA